MYLHLGQDVVVNSEEIIGIFDLENTSTSRFTREFLRRADRELKVVTVSYEMPKSYVLCGRGSDLTLYISQISSATLFKRAGRFLKEDSPGKKPGNA